MLLCSGPGRAPHYHLKNLMNLLNWPGDVEEILASVNWLNKHGSSKGLCFDPGECPPGEVGVMVAPQKELADATEFKVPVQGRDGEANNIPGFSDLESREREEKLNASGVTHEVDLHAEDSIESIHKLCRRIKKSENSLYNALSSIYEDSRFVREISSLWPTLPVLANLRCGLWYSTQFDGVCYFKSTDGHTGKWSFSTTRLNTHVAFLAAERGGCIIVDATRKGKRFPDSMSKTIPIWACVINRVVAQLRKSKMEKDGGSGYENWDCSLHLPLWVSETEKVTIEDHIHEWVQNLKDVGVDLGPLVVSLKKPLQPLWISQKSVIWLNEVPDASSWSFTPIILISASRPISSPIRMSDGDLSWTYIPGAGDDEESWARGLSAPLFWRHAYEIISCGPQGCRKKAADIVENDRVRKAFRSVEAAQIGANSLVQENDSSSCVNSCQQSPGIEGVYRIGATGLAISSVDTGLRKAVIEVFGCVINCAASVADCGSKNLGLQIMDSKRGRHSLQNLVPAAVVFARQKLDEGQTVLILCSTGEDISVCVCLAILLSCFRSTGVSGYERAPFSGAISRSDVRQCLAFVSGFHTHARPTRGNLKQVYNFLLGGKPDVATSNVD